MLALRRLLLYLRPPWPRPPSDVAETLAVRPAWATVRTATSDRESRATGGELHADTFGPGFGSAGPGDQARAHSPMKARAAATVPQITALPMTVV